jgi:hypothetical protein
VIFSYYVVVVPKTQTLTTTVTQVTEIESTSSSNLSEWEEFKQLIWEKLQTLKVRRDSIVRK